MHQYMYKGCTVRPFWARCFGGSDVAADAAAVSRLGRACIQLSSPAKHDALCLVHVTVSSCEATTAVPCRLVVAGCELQLQACHFAVL